MNIQQQEAAAYTVAKQKAWGIHRKLPASTKQHTDVADVVQNLMMTYMLYRHKYDPLKGEFGPWINEVMRNQGKDELSVAYREMQKSSLYRDPGVEVATAYNEDGVREHIVVDMHTPEMECIAYFEEQKLSRKVQVLQKEVRELCHEFSIQFIPDDYPKSLAMVLAHTLNKMSDEEFKKLPYATQLRLAKYGEALSSNSLQVTASGKVKSKGIVAVVRECVINGVHDLAEVKKVLDSRGMAYNIDSVPTLIWDEKKRANIPIEKKQTGIMAKMTDLFKEGKGITTPAEMMATLERLRIPYAPSTVRTHVQSLRTKYNIKLK